MTLLLGFLLGLVASLIANLVTPFMKPLWVRLRSLQQLGYQAQIRQQVKVLQTQLDRLNSRKVAPEKDLYLELFQWSLGIFSLFAAGVACAFIGMTASDVTDIGRARLELATLAFFIGAVTLSVVMLAQSRDMTSTGLVKRTAKLEADIAKLTIKLQ